MWASQPGAVVVVQSKNESLYDARKANEPPGPQPLSGRWERARGRSEGIFGHFCLSQFGLSAAHEQLQPSLVLAAQLELYKRARGSGAGLKAAQMISLLSTFLSSRVTVAYGKEGQGKARWPMARWQGGGATFRGC